MVRNTELVSIDDTMILNVTNAWLLHCQLSACWDTKLLMACLHCPHWTAYFRREEYVGIARSQIDFVLGRRSRVCLLTWCPGGWWGTWWGAPPRLWRGQAWTAYSLLWAPGQNLQCSILAVDLPCPSGLSRRCAHYLYTCNYSNFPLVTYPLLANYTFCHKNRPSREQSFAARISCTVIYWTLKWLYSYTHS